MVAVRLIGCGNADAGDDAVGLMAVRALRGAVRGARHVEIAEAPTGFHVLELLDGADAAIVIDAVRGPDRTPPGTTIRLDVDRDGVPAVPPTGLSSHGFGLREAFSLAAALERLPRTVFLGLQVARTDPGPGLAPQVARAMPGFVALIESEMRRLLVRQAAFR